MQYALTKLLIDNGVILDNSLSDDNSIPMPSEGFPRDTELALRYVRDRISIPRDMEIWPGKLLRQVLEDTASLISDRIPEQWYASVI